MTFRTRRSFSPHVRANHAIPPQPEAPAVLPLGRPGAGAGRPGAGWLPRPRALAAGGAVLAQVWGLGLGVTSAYAATGDPKPELVNRAESPALLDQLTGAAGPLLERQAAPVGQLLHDRIKAGGLPLPGQATTVPDAFAIAAVLLPSVPSQPRADDAPRASRSVPGGAEGRSSTGQVIPAAEAADPRADPAQPVQARTGRTRAVPVGQSVGAVPTADPAQPPSTQELALTAATPVDGDGDFTTVLVPIAAGMLLTGAAMYKHRGLPGGH